MYKNSFSGVRTSKMKHKFKLSQTHSSGENNMKSVNNQRDIRWKKSMCVLDWPKSQKSDDSVEFTQKQISI